MDSIPVSFFPSTPTGNLKLSGLFIELSNKSSKVKFELPDAEASGFYDQVTYLNSKPLIELSILAVYVVKPRKYQHQLAVNSVVATWWYDMTFGN